MSKLRSLWRKAKGYLYSGSGMAMLVVAEFAHGEGVGAIGRRAATEADGLGVGAQALFALAGLVMVGLSIFEIKKYNKTDGAQGKLSMAAILLFGGPLCFISPAASIPVPTPSGVKAAVISPA